MRIFYITFILLICTIAVKAQQQSAPMLLTKADSSRAIAVDSVTRTSEPFPLNSPISWGQDRHTSIMLFARNLILQPGENASVMTADAEDETHRHYPLKVEYVGQVPGQEQLTSVIVRLSDDIITEGDIQVQLTYHGVASNRVSIYLSAGQRYALSFNGSMQSIWYENFWQPNVNLGKFFYELWVKPGAYTGVRYLLSDGIGGAHAILFGLAGSPGGGFTPEGNFFDGGVSVPFGGDDGPSLGEWAHVAVGWDGSNIVSYYDGVPVGKNIFAGQRVTLGPLGGGGRLFIGGSNHQNFVGSIAQVRAYEGANPHQGVQQSTSAFTPQTFFEATGSSFLVSLLRPVDTTIIDLSSNNRRGVFLTWEGGTANPLPQFVVDPVGPNTSPSAQVNTLPIAPSNPIIFDSFSRRNSTYAFDGAGGLGLTERGSAGSRAWRFGNPGRPEAEPTNFGILNGRAVILSNGPGVAWVPTGSTASLDVRVNRHPGVWDSGLNTGMAFRVKDANNFCFAYTSGESLISNQLNVGCYYNGTRSLLMAPVSMPSFVWTGLRVVTDASTGGILIYGDNQLVASTSTYWLASESGVGLYNDTYGSALTNRWDNFAVYDLPQR